MTEAVRCGGCGVLYDARHSKCPRCKERAPQAVEARAARRREPSDATARRGLAVAASVGALALALAGAWAWTVPAAGAVQAAVAVGQPLARLIAREEPRKPVSRVPSEVGFVDSPMEGRQAYDDGNLEAALEHFRAQVESSPSNAEAYSNAGQVLVRLGRPSEALPLLQQAADLDPNRWAYRFNLARAKGLLGRWELAAQDYAEAATLFPGDYATLFNLGQALHRAGRETEAVERYRQAIELKADDPSFHLALGISEEKLGHAAEAAAAYRRYLAMEPASRQSEAVMAKARQLEAAPAPPSAPPTPEPGPM